MLNSGPLGRREEGRVEEKRKWREEERESVVMLNLHLENKEMWIHTRYS